MLDIYANWCISCKEMEKFTFINLQVQSLLQITLLVEADVSTNDDDDQALLRLFDLFGPPGIIFYDPNGNETPAARLVGYIPACKFKDHLRRFVNTIDL